MMTLSSSAAVPHSRRGAQSVDRAATKVVGRMHAYERLKSERLKSVVSATITADNANDAALIATGLTRERVNAALSVQLTNCEHGVDVQDGTRSRPLQAKPCGCQNVTSCTEAGPGAGVRGLGLGVWGVTTSTRHCYDLA
jgi:hypothetical protein